MESKGRPRHFWTREWVVASLAAAILLAWNMKNSFEFGRLAFVPSYDDVSYFDDAARRYLVFLNTNVLGVVRDLLANPPHAPVIAIQAFLAYVAFGIQDWAPYLTNVWIPLSVFLCLLAYTREWQRGRWAVFAYVATLPMLGAAIVEFRPDIAAGILTAGCVVMSVHAVTASERGRATAQAMAAGLLFAGALWSKPSAAPYTIGMAGLGLLLANLGLLVTHRRVPKDGLRRTARIVLVAVVCAMPYYLVAGHRVIEYTWNAVVRDKAIWAVQMEWFEHAGFYLLGHGGRFMLGFHVWVAVGATLIFILSQGRIDRLQRLRLAAILGTVVVGYLVVAVNTVKTQFLGVSFQALWIMLTILVLAELLQKKDAWIAKLVAIALLASSVLSIQPTAYWGLRSAAQTQDVRRVTREISDELSRLAAENPALTTVFLTFTGFVNRDVLSYELKKQGITWVQVNGWFFRPQEEDPREVFGRAIESADIVIAASAGTEVARSSMPANQILSFTLALVAQHPEYRLLKSIPSGTGSVFVYQRTRAGGRHAAR